MRRMPRATVLAAIAGLLLTGCGGGGSDNGPSAGGGHRPIDVAMTYAPKSTHGVEDFEFTDLHAVVKLVGKEFTKLGSVYHEETPGLWPFGDVEWEAVTISGGEPVHTVGLSSSFDLNRIARKLKACRYRERKVGGDVVYAASQSVVLACAGDFGADVPLQSEVGVARADHVVVLSNSSIAVESALRHEGDLHADDTLTGLLEPLADAQSVGIAPAPEYCQTLTKLMAGRDPTPEIVALADKEDPAGAPYDGFAIGTTVSHGKATGRIVMRYADDDAASKGVKEREQLFRSGTDFQLDGPYTDVLHLDGAKADGRNVVFDVSPAKPGELSLYEMWLKYDFAFARC